MSKNDHLIGELDLIEAFGFWLKHTLPGWSISRPTIAHTTAGKQHPRFVLYEHGVAVAAYQTPMGALEHIGNEQLTQEYLSLISGTDVPDNAGGDPASRA